jgi:radical SAM-linked protein
VKIRIRYAKLGKIRWTSHRDVARMWERAFRRAQLPLAYTAGFSPRPKVSFGLALPTGYESVAEFLDVELAGTAGFAPSAGMASTDLRPLPDRLSAALPSGVDATAIELLAPGLPSLQEDVVSCRWRWLAAPIEGSDPPGSRDRWAERLLARVESVLAAPSVIVTRTRKGEELTDDIRAGIENLQLIGLAGPDPAHGVWLQADLACRPRALRPSEVLSALSPDLELRQVCRTHQWILRSGARTEPLRVAAPSGATEAPHAMGRAS